MANEKLLIVPIILLALVGIMNVLMLVGGFSNSDMEGYNSTISGVNVDVPVVGFLVNPIINGISNWLLGFMVQDFAITTGLGLMALVALGILLALTGIAVQFGGSVLATGVTGSIKLSDVSVMIIYKSVILLSVWGIFTILALTAILSFPLFIGWIFYFILSAIYAIGVISQIGSTG